jgi:uncharacterized protein YrrD
MTFKLASCEGFAVYSVHARVGEVEGVRWDAEGSSVTALMVRAGLLGSWLLAVPVDQVAEVSVSERRIVLRSGGLLARPRPEAEGTRAA